MTRVLTKISIAFLTLALSACETTAKLVPDGYAGSTATVSRQIPTDNAAFFIVGRTHCAAPIQEMTGTVRLVGGNVEFTPEESAVYVSKGELAPDHSAVWIEDEKSGAQVGNKLLLNGPAKAGFFGVTGKVIEIPPSK